MPEFYSKSFRFQGGLTYAVGGGNPGYTSSLFPTGACYMDGVNAIITSGSTQDGVNVTMVLAGATLPISLGLRPGVIYEFRPRVLGWTGPATQGLIGLL